MRPRGNAVPQGRAAVLDWLGGRVDFERTPPKKPGADFGLGRMRRLLARLDAPHDAFPVVHVAGTKGKGSTVELVYWGVYGIGSSASFVDPADTIDVIPQAPGAMIGGTPAAEFLADARGQQIARSDLVNNVEVNWVYALGDRPEFLPRQGPFSLMWLAGFRFFQVNDVLTLTSLPGDAALGPADLSVATNNNLYGGQVGAKLDWRFLPSVRLNVVPKFLLAGSRARSATGRPPVRCCRHRRPDTPARGSSDRSRPTRVPCRRSRARRRRRAGSGLGAVRRSRTWRSCRSRR